MGRRRTIAITAGVLLAIGAGWTAWHATRPDAGPASPSPAPAGATSAPAPPPPARSLLLVTIDTLRADRVGAYGYARARTPAFDAIAREGTRFARAYAPAPITLPSHATLLTGRYPPGHGSRHNGMRIRDDLPTLASHLRGAGLSTAAFVSAFPLDPRFGLAAGFDTYDARLPRSGDGRPVNERPGHATVDAALAWLATHRDRPFFLWVHLFEPHAPYEAREGVPADAPAEARYDAEIAEADRQVRRVLDGLGAARPSTIVAITSDHGEAFGEHGEVGHSVFVYDTTLRVPLALAGPGVPRGRVHETPIGLADLAPTVLSLLGAPPMDADGVDLSPALGSQDTTSARVLYAESYAPLLDFGWSPLRSVRAGPWKFIEAPRPELFDLATDSAESHDLAARSPAEIARLATELARFGSGSLTLRFGLDAEAASRLGALGYVSASPAQPADGRRPDPKDRRAIAERLALVFSGELPPDRQAEALRAVLREEPGNAQAHLRLGTLLSSRGDCAGADPHLRAAIAARVPSADPYISLAFCLRAAGDARAARGVLAAARKVEPGNPVVEANLGLLAFDQGHLDEAIEALGAAVRIDPDLHEARFVLARALARAGRLGAARDHARALLDRLPADAPQRAEVQRLLEALR